MEPTKYLFLKFENAAFFRDMHGTSDRILDLRGNTPRVDSVQYVEPITVFHISNMLHVLMGERPAPSLRVTRLKPISEIFDMANNGYLKITTIKIPNTKNGTWRYPDESITLRKAVWNAHSTIPHTIHWERVRRLLENELYDHFINTLNEVFNENVVKVYTCEEAMAKLRNKYLTNQKIVDLIQLLKKQLKKPLVNFIESPSAEKTKAFNSNDRTLITVLLGVDRKTSLSGEIIIPMDDASIEKIRFNKGIATLLDGGSVWISRVVDESEMYESMLDGYTPIKDISIETKKIKPKS